jgi:hypothetical protein
MSQLGTGQEHMQHLGYAFSQNESDATISQADMIRRYDSTKDKPLGD